MSKPKPNAAETLSISKDSVTHIVLRASPELRSAGRRFDLVAEHNNVVDEGGAVVVGVVGRTQHDNKWSILRAQLGAGRAVMLYMVFKISGSFVGYCAPINAVYAGKLPPEASDRVPDYYQYIDAEMNYWVEIGSELQPADLSPLRLSSNGRPLLEVISECRTSTMLVQGGRC